jgi:hypothetical protein
MFGIEFWPYINLFDNIWFGIPCTKFFYVVSEMTGNHGGQIQSGAQFRGNVLYIAK